MMVFDWTPRSVGEWRELYAKLPRSNYLQSVPFARAVRIHDRKVTRLGLVVKDGEPCAMLAIQEIKLGPIHVVYLYRGPMWFDEHPKREDLETFAQLFSKTFPRRPLRMRRWLPEWDDGENVQQALTSHGFRPRQETYETMWLDLTKPLKVLRASLKQKWRNALNKGEKSSIEVQTDWSGSTMNMFLAQYEKQRTEKKQPGRSAAFIGEEIKTARAFKDALILWAVKDQKVVAGIMVLTHGRSATYRIGWTTDAGRNCNAHNVLLWEAVKTLKHAEIRSFDLGGVEPTTAAGVTQFKAGMGGQAVRAPGMFS